jgi:hypothetical protein
MPKKTRKTWGKTTIFLDIPILKSNISGFRTKTRPAGGADQRKGQAGQTALPAGRMVFPDAGRSGQTGRQKALNYMGGGGPGVAVIPATPGQGV